MLRLLAKGQADRVQCRACFKLFDERGLAEYCVTCTERLVGAIEAHLIRQYESATPVDEMWCAVAPGLDRDTLAWNRIGMAISDWWRAPKKVQRRRRA